MARRIISNSNSTNTTKGINKDKGLFEESWVELDDEIRELELQTFKLKLT